MFVHRSNRVEALFQAMADIVAVPLPDPFAEECIVVPSRGLATWVSMQLAERFGVWAGGDFPFLRRFLHRTLDAVLGRADADAYTAPRLLWPILAELPQRMDDPAFAGLVQFVGPGSDERMRFQLAQRIAAVFDQYTVFRPEMLLAWEHGKDADWQAELWRKLVARLGSNHPAAMARSFFEALGSDRPIPGVLPSRVCIFGVTTLPPMYLQLLAALSERCEVHLFVVSPSREYWAEMRSHREALRAFDQNRGELAWEDRAPHLLASLGSVGRDFQAVLETVVDYREYGPERYVDPGSGQTMLHTLQSDLLHFRSRSPGDRIEVSTSDDSIAIHACHSPMREVEVLHDQLLAQFARDPSLQPHDVVVMMSDVETYAPLVEAVFQRDTADASHIPYCVADRSLRSDSPTIEALHRILAVVGTRVTVSAVLDLLTLEPIAAHFEIAPEDVDTLTAWVTESGVRWGIDAPHRAQHGQPEMAENTWRFGLNRLLLGYAMPGSGISTFQNVLPYDELEGQQTLLLGRLSEFCEILFAASTELAGARPIARWQEDLGTLLDKTLAGPDANAWDVQRIRGVLDELVSEAGQAEFEGALDLTAVLALLSERIEDERTHRAFLGGGVTFCAMLPMRSVPFRVVAMLGLGDEQFPRRSETVSFDHMAKAPKPGDRSRRADDRYLFLEALLAARKQFWVFYVGQSIQDNSEVPPSVVLSDLLDALNESFVGRSGPVARALVVRHPMQPFSPRYFGADPDPRLFSYGASYVEGARALQCEGLRQDVVPFLTERLPALELDDGHELPLTDLVRFYRMPAAALLKRRLGVYLDEWRRDRSDREPMDLLELERWRVGQALLDHQLAGRSAKEAFELLRASGSLPLGTVGRCSFEELEDVVTPILVECAELRAAGPLPDLNVDLKVGRTRLVGTLRSRWPGGTAKTQFARIGAKHRLEAWIQHLVLCLAAPTDQALHTVLVGRGDNRDDVDASRFGPVPAPAPILEQLVDLYWRGQEEPLLFFPRTSWEFCQRFCKTHDAHDAVRAARKIWNAWGNWGDRDEPHVARLFGDQDILDLAFSLFGDADMTFASLAVQIFGPLWQALDQGDAKGCDARSLTA